MFETLNENASSQKQLKNKRKTETLPFTKNIFPSTDIGIVLRKWKP